MEKLLKKKDACDLLGVSPKTLTKIIRDDGLPVIKVGHRVRFVQKELLEHLRNVGKVGNDQR